MKVRRSFSTSPGLDPARRALSSTAARRASPQSVLYSVSFLPHGTHDAQFNVVMLYPEEKDDTYYQLRSVFDDEPEVVVLTWKI